MKLGLLRAFFGFSFKAGWVRQNYALDLKPGRVVEAQIVPLEPEEFDKIIKACDQHPYKDRRPILRAMLLVMRYSGLRIRDVVTLRRDSIVKEKLFLRTSKTGTDVYCPLPPSVVSALNLLPAEGKHFFWNGHSKPRSAVGNYQKSLALIFESAGVSRAYPHLFRHTFATDLLQKGVSVQNVAMLLAHSSTKMTERRYSHWIKSRLDSLEADVKKSWTHLDPVTA